MIMESIEVTERIEEFMRTHVSRYVLPGKLDAAQRKGAPTVSVPVTDAVRLLRRVGEHAAPVSAPQPPELPETLTALPTELADSIDWEPASGWGLVHRGDVEALISRAVNIAYHTPRATVRRKPAATVTETVAAALTAGKRSVTIPTEVLAGMLDQVAAERAHANVASV